MRVIQATTTVQLLLLSGSYMHWQSKPKALQNNQGAKQTQQLTETLSSVVRGGGKIPIQKKSFIKWFQILLYYFVLVTWAPLLPPPIPKKGRKKIENFLFSLQACNICPAPSGFSSRSNSSGLSSYSIEAQPPVLSPAKLCSPHCLLSGFSSWGARELSSMNPKTN